MSVNFLIRGITKVLEFIYQIFSHRCLIFSLHVCFEFLDSKSKLFSKSYKRKSKRDDDEDAELEEMKMSAIASLGGESYFKPITLRCQ